MTAPMQDVLLHPHSITARRALAEYWAKQGDPRAPLIERQLQLRDGSFERGRFELLDDIRELLEEHGHAWAGRVADLCDSYRYELGLVAAVALPAQRFIECARDLISSAPIVHVSLRGPMDIAKLCAVPELAQISTLGLDGGEWMKDEAALAMAASPYIRRLRITRLTGGSITKRGVLALARSPNLENVISIELSGNPCEQESLPAEMLWNDGGCYLLGKNASPYLAAAHRIAARSYDPMGALQWPPLPERLAYDDEPSSEAAPEDGPRTGSETGR